MCWTSKIKWRRSLPSSAGIIIIVFVLVMTVYDQNIGPTEISIVWNPAKIIILHRLRISNTGCSVMLRKKASVSKPWRSEKTPLKVIDKLVIVNRQLQTERTELGDHGTHLRLGIEALKRLVIQKDDWSENPKPVEVRWMICKEVLSNIDRIARSCSDVWKRVRIDHGIW